jgi:zinc protease
MKKSLIALSSFIMLGGIANAQKVAFEEYDLANGMHVILHNDSSAPVVITSVMYHVGSKDENQKELVLPTFLNTFYLKELPI